MSGNCNYIFIYTHIYCNYMYIYFVMSMGKMAMVRTGGGNSPENAAVQANSCHFRHLEEFSPDLRT